MHELSIVYMVAGMSSRFGGKIKQFAIVGPEGETLIEYSFKQALKANIQKIILIVGEKTEQPFKEKFGTTYRGIPIFYARQTYNSQERDKPWGTVDALLAASPLIVEPCIVCNGDDLYGSEAFTVLVHHIMKDTAKETATVGYPILNVLPEQGAANRGILEVDTVNNVQRITEVFAIEKSNLQATGRKETDLCSMNIFALYPETLSLLKEKFTRFKAEHKGDRKKECILPTEFSTLIQEKKIVMKTYTTTEPWYGVTNVGDELTIQEALKDTPL